MESTPKNKPKKSFLKPVIAIYDSLAHPMPKHNASDPVLSYLAAADKDGTVLPAVFSSVFAAADCGCRRRKKWPSLRTALNENTLTRMVIRRRKANKNKISLTRTSSNLGETNGKITNPKCKVTARSSSFASSTFGVSSSACLSSSISLLRGDDETYSASIPLNATHAVTKQKQHGVEYRKKGDYGSNTALCMLSMTLLIMIFWGKFVAILCTSMWLYLVPRYRRKPCNEGGDSAFDSLQNKKKLFIEGLLPGSTHR
ncbi:hypothetical protein CR513_37264, partial [Mucuna pruriens]